MNRSIYVIVVTIFYVIFWPVIIIGFFYSQVRFAFSMGEVIGSDALLGIGEGL